MPEQELHREFYRLFGLTDERGMRLVDDMIDYANYRPGYRKFREQVGYTLPPGGGAQNHNRARRDPLDAKLDLMYLQKKDFEFRIAYFLHHLLDLYSKRKDKTARSISECRGWARAEMHRIFNSGYGFENLLSRYKLREEFWKADAFFKSTKSQHWLENLPAKRREIRKRLK